MGRAPSQMSLRSQAPPPASNRGPSRKLLKCPERIPKVSTVEQLIRDILFFIFFQGGAEKKRAHSRLAPPTAWNLKLVRRWAMRCACQMQQWTQRWTERLRPGAHAIDRLAGRASSTNF